MEIIKEYIFKEILLLLISLLVIEIFITILLYKRQNIIYKETYKETEEKVIQKALEIVKKYEELTINYMLKYLGDLKLIGLHSLLFNINKTDDNINFDNTDKKIYSATSDVLSNVEELKKFFGIGGKSYLDVYEEEFENNTDTTSILSSLLDNSKHPELNYISCYFPNIDELNERYNIEQSLNEREINNIKNIIPILKSLYVKRYLVKRANLDYIRFFIINKEKMFIYPPSPYNITQQYFFKNNIDARCNEEDNPFPLCYYNYLNTNYYSKYNFTEHNSENSMSMLVEKVDKVSTYGSICIKMRYIKEEKDPSIICLGLDYSNLFRTSAFSNIEKYQFGIYTILDDTLVEITNSNMDKYDIIYNYFSNKSKDFHPLLYLRGTEILGFFHFFYYNLSMSVDNHTDLIVDWNEIDKEYNFIIEQIKTKIKEYNDNEDLTYLSFDFNKTICQKKLLKQGYEIVNDQFKMIITPVHFIINELDYNFGEIPNPLDRHINMYIYSIISTNPKLNEEKLSEIMKIKMIRLLILYILFSFIVISFYLLLICLFSQHSFNPINNIANHLTKLDMTNKDKSDLVLEELEITENNKEILELKEIYNLMKNILVIKNSFEKENYLKEHNYEFYNVIKGIKTRYIKEVCTSFQGFFHFKNGAYNLAENDFHSTVLYLREKENEIISGKNDENIDKIKDSIKRSSSESYINEFSKFEKIDENILLIIRIEILLQRFIYLYAMTKFKLSIEINKSKNQDGPNEDPKKYKKEKEKKISLIKDAINYFNESKKINTMLGINQIKVIYTLIMLSQCYTQLSDYRQAMNNINGALSLFFEFSKSFKDYHSKNYNPRIMLFIENNIFHYILFTMSNICNSFNKPNVCNWINLKLFETSPFILGNVHLKSGIMFQNLMERNKALTKSDAKNKNVLKEIEKTKNFFSKFIQRLRTRYLNTHKKNLFLDQNKLNTSFSSYITKKDERASKSNLSFNFRKEMSTNKQSLLVNLKRNTNKIITLCLSEKILKKISGIELKDVIIKYFQKFFVSNDKDKFSFLQFADNGKKTVYIKLEQLNSFLLKIQKTKNSFELTDTYISNSNIPFLELYNIFDSIINSYPQNEENLTDNIIIMFIDSDDIRFQSINECIKIVEDLKKKNTSVFLLSYNDEIDPDKINNINSFLNGFYEAYFFQIKNYQQLKQIFIYISNINYQSNFFGYNFDILDQTL